MSDELFNLREDRPRNSVKKAVARESATTWGLVLVGGLAIGAYAVYRGMQPVPIAPSVAAPVAESAPGSKPQTTVRRPQPTPREAPSPARKVTTVYEKPRKNPTPVDPAKGFESGEAFDNPSSPGDYRDVYGPRSRRP